MEECYDGLGRNHIREDGRFFNPWSHEAENLVFEYAFPGLQLLKFFKFKRAEDQINPDATSPEVLDIHLPVTKLNKHEYSERIRDGLLCCWLGHATCLVSFDGITLLTDPALGERRFHKRLRDVPCAVSELPEVDIVVISHNHFDHLDLKTVKQLNNTSPKIYWYVGLGLAKWFFQIGCKNVIELDWWEEHKFSDNITVVFTPSQHWSKRTAFDTNRTLWGSWVIKGPRHNFFHAGDTGYCQTFAEIGRKFGPFDFAAIPIGAYEPRDLHRLQHVNPTEAVKIHNDIRSKNSIGIHWGTFPLGKEPFLEPPRKLREACITEPVRGHFFTMNIGEIFDVLS